MFSKFFSKKSRALLQDPALLLLKFLCLPLIEKDFVSPLHAELKLVK